MNVTSRMRITGRMPTLLRRTRNETNETSTLLSNQQVHTVRFNVSFTSFRVITALRDRSMTLNLRCPRSRCNVRREQNIMERTDAKKRVSLICTHNAARRPVTNGGGGSSGLFMATATKHIVQVLNPPDYIRVLSL